MHVGRMDYSAFLEGTVIYYYRIFEYVMELLTGDVICSLLVTVWNTEHVSGAFSNIMSLKILELLLFSHIIKRAM